MDVLVIQINAIYNVNKRLQQGAFEMIDSRREIIAVNTV